MSVIAEDILNEAQQAIIKDFTNISKEKDIFAPEENIKKLIYKMYDNIPDNKRISYGITYVIKTISKMFYENIENPYDFAIDMYSQSDEYRVKCVGLGILSYIGRERPYDILPIFEDAAASDVWEVKEFVQMFIRKVTKKHPDKVQKFLIKMAKSDNPDKRRFASESLRPVAENRWINENPDFSLKVLRLLFREKHKYPKASVGNNLSDLSRKHPELIYKILEELMNMNDKNSAFIAYRACRNLVKEDTCRVMDALGVNEYTYKNRRYKRETS